MKLNIRGFGIAQTVIMCGFLVFLIIPLFLAMTEKIYIKYSVHRVNELADTAVMSSVMGINTNELSEGNLSFENSDRLEDRILTTLESNEPGNVEIAIQEVSVLGGGQICTGGGHSDYDYVHLLIKVSMERYNKEKLEFYIHRDIEFMQNWRR